MAKEIPYYVEITHIASGETRRMKQKDILWGEGSEYWWSEGNFGCDCNRADEFYNRENEDHPCGVTAFRVKCFAMNGDLLYEDAEIR